MPVVKVARLVGLLPLGDRLPGKPDRTTMPDSTQLTTPKQLIDMATGILEQTRHLLDRQEARLRRGEFPIRFASIRAQRHEPEPRTGVLQRGQDPRDVRRLRLLLHLEEILEQAIDIRHDLDSTR
jgi:hypothetical protein